MLRKNFADEHKHLKSGRFGIHLLKQAPIWENDFNEVLAAGKPVDEVYAVFTERLRWLQHERLVHLLVLMLTVTALLFTFGLALLLTGTAAAWALTLILGVLTMFYTVHYFKLENLVQRWYLIEVEILKYSKGAD